jgi:hypothetical protein
MISCGISIFQHPSMSIVIRINTYVGFQMFVERIVTHHLCEENMAMLQV